MGSSFALMWWSLLIVIPIVNLIGFWIFAFARWPAIDPPEAL